MPRSPAQDTRTPHAVRSPLIPSPPRPVVWGASERAPERHARPVAFFPDTPVSGTHPVALDALRDFDDDEDDETIVARAARVFRAPPPAIDDLASPAPLSVRPTNTRPVDVSSFEQRYEPRELLGEGGMGEVRLFKDRLIGREVALKVIRKGVSHEAARERFVREARVQGQLEHPAIVPVYDLGVDPSGDVYFTMKRVRGRTLDEVLALLGGGDPRVKERYSRRKLLGAFATLCLAIDFAHARGVLHRDLKPGNVILGDFGEVYVLDWGLAKIAGAPESAQGGALHLTREGLNRTMQGTLIGTPGYMSPEQACGDLARLDARSEVYALGAILFEILALEPLHPEGPIESILGSTLRGIDARPSTRGADVPPELDAICACATALNAGERYPSARALAEAVERYLDGEAASAARAAALRQVSAALAPELDAEGERETLAKLPAEAKVVAGPGRDAARAGAIQSLLWIFAVPLALWARDPRPITAALALAAMLACGAVALGIARRADLPRGQALALLGLSSLAIALLGALVGPAAAPGPAAINAIFFALGGDRRDRRVAIGASAITAIAPIGIGALLPAASFHAAASLPGAIGLSIVGLATVLVPGGLAGWLRDAIGAAPSVGRANRDRHA